MLTPRRPARTLEGPRRRARGLRRFAGEASGVAALEFALIAPVILVLYFGMVELCQGMMADRRASHSASAIGDLVAQSPQLYASDFSDIYAVANTIMAPFPTTTLKLRITSVTAGGAPGLTPTVDWSEVPDGQGGFAPITKGSTVTLPAGLITNPGDNVLMAEGQYQYTSAIGYFLPQGLTFSPRFYLRPRNVAMVKDCKQNPAPTGC